VELNNRLLLAKKAEEAEERRVLLWLTALVRGELPRLESVFATLSEIDVLRAKVVLARQHHCRKPRFGGTDPVEGGALACGVLTHLKTCGVLVAAATHLTPVKLFALAEGSYQVAAVEFDLETLTPHYWLRYDTIGQSLGLPMARRLGVPEAACAAAEAALSHEARQLSQALAKLEETRASLEHERALVAAEREQTAALRLRQQALVTELEEKKRVLQEELTEARLLVRRLRQEGRALITNLHDRVGVMPAERHDAREKLAQFIHQQEEALKTREQSPPPAHSADHSLPQVGDEVEVKDKKIRGKACRCAWRPCPHPP
jgi:DNA mismatch repair protein MutS2